MDNGEPWHRMGSFIYNSRGKGIARTDASGIRDDVQKARARRIIACVNACKGIPTAFLEKGFVSDAVGAFIAAIEKDPGEVEH